MRGDDLGVSALPAACSCLVGIISMNFSTGDAGHHRTARYATPRWCTKLNIFRLQPHQHLRRAQLRQRLVTMSGKKQKVRALLRIITSAPWERWPWP